MRATDGGFPPLFADVDVELEVVDRNNKPPIWDKKTLGREIYVRENAPQGEKVTEVRARFVKKKQARPPTFLISYSFN